LITDFLTTLLLDGGAVINHTFKVKTDKTLSYPFFETEISVEISAINY